MMQTVNIHEAKTNLSRLIALAVKGEPFIIAKAGKPLVKVTALDGLDAGSIPKRRWGLLEGKFKIPDDFDTMYQEEIIALFEGEEG
jgi:prevent-host-death family protein